MSRLEEDKQIKRFRDTNSFKNQAAVIRFEIKKF